MCWRESGKSAVRLPKLTEKEYPFEYNPLGMTTHLDLDGFINPKIRKPSKTCHGNILNKDTMNPCIIAAQYAVRGVIPLEAERLQKILDTHPNLLPFKKIVRCNIGNPQVLGQSPISFFRQVSALIEVPWLLSQNSSALTSCGFSLDAISRAKTYLAQLSPIGAYSHSKGSSYIRSRIADYLLKRDGFPSDPEAIFLTSGASSAIQMVLQLIISNENVGVLLSRPQYPLYSAEIINLNGKIVFYDLDEEYGWSLNISSIISALNSARQNGIDVRAISIINPGNPTGNVFSKQNLCQIIRLCRDENLILLADEVYQTNIYFPESKPFYSAKKVLKEMGPEYAGIELFSFHSISKGVLGECGRRGGYVECTGIDPDVLDEFYKLASMSLCSNTLGQVMIDLMLHPPKPGDESYPLYIKEVESIHESLKRRACKFVSVLRSLEGVSCQNPEGALYVFPSYTFPNTFIEEAKELQLEPDAFYALKLLHATGICSVNGSGFGQKEGTYHIRFTFLPPEEDFEEFLGLLESFHIAFMEQYRDKQHIS